MRSRDDGQDGHDKGNEVLHAALVDALECGWFGQLVAHNKQNSSQASQWDVGQKGGGQQEKHQQPCTVEDGAHFGGV